MLVASKKFLEKGFNAHDLSRKQLILVITRKILFIIVK